MYDENLQVRYSLNIEIADAQLVEKVADDLRNHPNHSAKQPPFITEPKTEGTANTLGIRCKTVELFYHNNIILYWATTRWPFTARI